MRALDCQTFAGTFALATRDAGFDLVGKRESGNFGVPMYLDNADLLGIDPATVQVGDADGWVPENVDFVFGNPPCSGFSLLSTCINLAGHTDDRAEQRDYRGVHSPANAGMRNLIDLAGSCDPTIVVFESVTGAFKQGRSLMQELRAQLEMEAGATYALHHVLHNNLTLGGYAERNRYFFVASRVPFGVEYPELDRLLTLRDAISDLQHAPFDLATGHVTIDSPRARRLSELASKVEWNCGELSGVAFQRAIKQNVELEHWNRDKPGIDSRTSMYAASRWKYDAPARVLRKYACEEQVHPEEPRPFTYRECARIMGLPDEWQVGTAIGNQIGQQFFGKGIPYKSGRWIAEWAAASLNGEPGTIQGDQIGDREYVIDVRKQPTWLEQRLPL